MFEKTLDLGGLVIRGVVEKEDDAFECVASCIRGKIAQMLAELDVAPSRKRVPHDAFAWPEQGDEAVHALGVTQRFDVARLSSSRPASFDFWGEFGPFLVLDPNEDLFFKSAGAMRL